ncbi:Valyl-tRNA synthetase [Dissulfuribacter thermophilus]|uniref:Valine--tRNA ligase n=1 Tax=Dissulfuribacter thermophilus TaxID=1156395 RepID=A0A1B9F8L6_9BACT|nr:valine--tRNA ligase [Dissulfuribacter thermophilus]OCC16288.1 Valyl-tRNA synthetase [Dissulfuribacter thermophilus]
MSEARSNQGLPKAYDFAPVEQKWYREWVEKGLFKPIEDPSRPAFSMVIPPPNVTGVLHIGHALNNTLQDILARYKRMDGYATLWVPGTDHAGIATQNVVERMLAQEGLTRHDLGREKFIDRVWEWKKKSGGRIIEQLKRLGCSCDWSRERFTMDEGLSRAVREVFVRLFEEGLIYKGDYIINWCPRCHTALADIEVEHEEKEGKLWHIKYPVVDADANTTGSYIIVATTRPETMLGDTAVAVHPEDDRYKDLVGKEIELPLVNRKIPVIADDHVDPEFGTGAVKVTPAHDFNDFEMGLRHKLPSVNIFDENARINENGGPYKGLDRYEARSRIIEDLEANGLLEKVDEHLHAVGHCYRCKTVVEPRLSKQWFVKVKPLAEVALNAVKEGRTNIVPESWFRTYEEWMTNIRDWCISRQIWWGHRIPAWECENCGELIVKRDDPVSCPKCGSTSLKREQDVLDTWFSSALWPFSTLGWPDETEDLRRFYPTSVLITSFDILFFWVARMMMMGLHFMGDVPFKYVYLHALVRDKDGKKMSKSKGNVIDPLVIMEKYGTDAVRFTLAAFAAQGRDIKLSEERIEGYKHFINKIWNASRLILMNLDEKDQGGLVITQDIEELKDLKPNLPEKWILSRLMHTTENVRTALDAFDFDVAARALYSFFWHEFCDWYLEMAKPHLNSESEAERNRSIAVSLFVLDSSLRLLHPFIPFVTEELWHYLPGKSDSYIMTAPFPKVDSTVLDREAEDAIQILMSIIGGIRNSRAELGIHPGAQLSIKVLPHTEKIKNLIQDSSIYIKQLARVEKIEFLSADDERPKGSATIILDNVEIFISLSGLLDVEEELNKLSKQEKKLRNDLERSKKKLENPNFVNKAPEDVVAKEKEKVEQFLKRLEKIEHHKRTLEELCKKES